MIPMMTAAVTTTSNLSATRTPTSSAMLNRYCVAGIRVRRVPRSHDSSDVVAVPSHKILLEFRCDVEVASP